MPPAFSFLKENTDLGDRFDHTRWLPSGQARNDERVKKVYTPFGVGARSCIGLHLASMELRIGAFEFFRRFPSARLAQSTTPESMEMENFFLIAPKSHRCEVEV
jgi:cytochrome P450